MIRNHDTCVQDDVSRRMKKKKGKKRNGEKKERKKKKRKKKKKKRRATHMSGNIISYFFCQSYPLGSLFFVFCFLLLPAVFETRNIGMITGYDRRMVCKNDIGVGVYDIFPIFNKFRKREKGVL